MFSIGHTSIITGVITGEHRDSVFSWIIISLNQSRYWLIIMKSRCYLIVYIDIFWYQHGHMWTYLLVLNRTGGPSWWAGTGRTSLWGPPSPPGPPGGALWAAPPWTWPPGRCGSSSRGRTPAAPRPWGRGAAPRSFRRSPSTYRPRDVVKKRVG